MLDVSADEDRWKIRDRFVRVAEVHLSGTAKYNNDVSIILSR